MTPAKIMPRISMLEFTILMASLMSVVAISIDATMPALGMIGRDLSVAHPNHVQYIISFIFLGMGLGEIVAGPYSDAWGRKRILYIGLALFLVGSAISLVSQSITVMLIGRFIQGVGVAGPYMSAISIVRDKYAGRDMARILSLVMMIFVMVPAIAPSLGQGIMLFLSWRYIFAFYLVYASGIGLWLFLRLEETLPQEKRISVTRDHILHGLRDIIGNRATVCYTICMGIFFGAFMGYLNSAQQVFQDHFHTGTMFTVYFSGLALLFGVSSLLNAKLVDVFGMASICLYSAVCIIVASSVFLWLNMVMPVGLWMFLGYAAILFFCFGLMIGNLNALAMEPMGHIAGIAAAVTGSAGSLISMVIGTWIGQLYNDSLLPLTTGFLLSGVLSWLIMLYAKRS